MTRRDFSFALPAAGLVGAKNGEDLLTIHSRVFSFDKLPVHYSTSGATTRPVLNGKLPTGEIVEIHETTLMPGQMPHAAHRHVHTELMLIREGVVEFIMEGRTEQIGPGGVAYAASGELHGLKNVGTVPANYFVIAIGNQSA